MRSIWKGHFYKNKKFLHKSSTLFNTMLKKKFYIYTGKEQKLFTVDRQSIGLKVGEFVFTRKMGIIHKKKDKNKKGKK